MGPKKEDEIEDFWPIPLPIIEIKTLAKDLAKRPVLVVDGDIVGDAQTCAVSGRYTHDHIYLMRYIVERVGNRSGFGRVLVSLDQSNDFDWVDHHYLVSVLKAAGFGPAFRGWITTI